MIGTCSFAHALTLSGEKAISAIKALKLAMVVLEVPWALTTDNGPACASQQFSDFLGSHTAGIPAVSNQDVWGEQ